MSACCGVALLAIFLFAITQKAAALEATCPLIPALVVLLSRSDEKKRSWSAPMRLCHEAIRFLIVPLLASSFPAAASSQVGTIDQRADDLLSRMTLDEKVGQLVQYSDFNDERGAAIREGIRSERDA